MKLRPLLLRAPMTRWARLAEPSRASVQCLHLVRAVWIAVLAGVLPVTVSADPDTWSPAPALNVARAAPAVVRVGSDIYAIGGRDAAGNALASMEVHTVGSGSWTTLGATMPTARYASAVAVVGGAIYVIGGFATGGTALRVVESFDPGTSMWTSHALTPAPRGGSCAAEIGGKIYLFGGALTGGSPTGTVYVYDPGTNTWQVNPAMPGTVVHGSSAVINGLAYVSGGEIMVGVQTNATNAFDAMTGWVPRSSLNEARSRAAVGIVNGFMYAVGGTGGGGPLVDAEVYHPLQDQWQVITVANPVPRAEVGGAVAYDATAGSDVMYAVGGVDAGGTATTNVETLTPATFALNTVVVGLGSVSTDPDRPSWPRGTTAQLTAIPAPYHVFAGWSGAAGGSDNPVSVLIDGTKTVTATFELPDSVPPMIESITDVADDEGGAVNIRFRASGVDLPDPEPITYYGVYRRAPPAAAPEGARPAFARRPGATASPPVEGWDLVDTVPATGDSAYVLDVPTLADSSGAGVSYAVYFVRAETGVDSLFFDSIADSGYSVDNLPPAPPDSVTARFTSTATYLHWAVSTEPDFATYKVYRDTTGDFVPGPANLLATKPDTGYVDTGSTWSYYKLSAVDVHGNESAFTLLDPIIQASGPTPPGSDVDVPLGETLDLTFQNVSSGGVTDVTIQTGGKAPPSGFKIAPSSPTKYYQITTTATFSGDVMVCITYDENDVSGNENHLRMMVYDTTQTPHAWVEITSSRDPVANVICGLTTHFSEFAMMEPAPVLAVGETPPAALQLFPGVPNPMRASAALRFVLPSTTPVRLTIYDTNGRRIRELVHGVLAAGVHEYRWDGRDASGRAMANGLYLARLEAGGGTVTRKLVRAR